MDYEKLLQIILDIGEEMAVSGAEVSRVEDSIYRMCESYGADRINVFTITSNIQVTMEAPDGRIITQIRRLVRYEVNFDRLDYLNDLSRYICKNKPDLDEIEERLEKVLARPDQPLWLKFAGCILAAGGFAVFFGGTVLDGAAAAAMGAAIVVMNLLLAPKEKNQIVYNFIVSLGAGIFALMAMRLGLGNNSDKIIIGGIMLLIPGIAMTNAVRDMLMGDIAAGLLRLVNSVLIAAAIACGFAVAIILLGGRL